jgi:hypothetical protein
MPPSSDNNTTPPDFAIDDNVFALRPDVTLSDQTTHLTMVSSTSLSAATPRTSRLLQHEPASFMNAALVPNAHEEKDVFTCTVDAKQFPETMDRFTPPSTKQSSQLDSMLLSKLPRELRDKIYREAVVEEKDVPIRVLRYGPNGLQRRRLHFQHPLMRVCRQTRQEVADIDHLENTFRITNDLFDERAISELRRHFTPWAGKLKKLGISHSFARRHGDPAKINFTISASQGRIIVEPESFSVQEMTVAVDIGMGTMNLTATTFKNMCFCKIHKLVLEKDCRDVLSWLQEYVDLVLKSQAERGTVPHCWTCAGRVII